MSVTFALAKGRLADTAAQLLQRAGVDCSALDSPGRKLIIESSTGEYKFLLVKPSDVPTYVDSGVADIGVAGKDTLLEENRPLYEMLDLGYAKCRMCVAGYPEICTRVMHGGHIRVATKYPRIAGSYFDSKGQTVEIIKLNGSVELGPLVNLSDVIVDIVESGATLRANGLEIIEDICDISARLVVNRVSLKTKNDVISRIINNLKTVLKEMNS